MTWFTLQDAISLGLKREVAELIPPGERVLDVGGNTVIPSSIYTRAQGWDAERMRLGWENDGSIDTIHCYHFLEHLSGDGAIAMLRDFQRVLKIGGSANILVPYYTSQMQAHDLDHKSRWCEETWRNIFNCPYYPDKGGDWRLKVRVNLILGLVERNLSLFTQLERV